MDVKAGRDALFARSAADFEAKGVDDQLREEVGTDGHGVGGGVPGVDFGLEQVAGLRFLRDGGGSGRRGQKSAGQSGRKWGRTARDTHLLIPKERQV